MKKPGFGIYFIVYAIALVLAAGSFTVLKLFSVDPITGFVDLGRFSIDWLLVRVFQLTLLVAVVFWFFITLRRRAHHDFPVSYRHIPTSILAILTGLAMMAYSMFALPQQLASPHQQQFTNKILLTAAVLFGIMGGISMIVGGFRPQYGVSGKPGAMLGFFPAVWQLVVLLIRFNSFIGITTIYDVTLLVLFMCFSAMFLIGQSRIIFGLGVRNGKTYALPAGLSASLIGLTFVIPNLISFFAKGRFLFMPTISLFEFAYVLFLSLYAVVFLSGYSRSIRVV